MKKSTVLYIIALIGAGLMGGACTAYGWYKYDESIKDTKFEI